MYIFFKDVYFRSIFIKYDEIVFSIEEEKKENKVSKLRIDGLGELVKDFFEIVEEYEKF